MPKALVIRTAGTNCDAEMLRAFQMAGAEAELVHLDRLIADPARLEGYDLYGFPGGFSYGDDIASGRVFAMKIRERLYPALREAAIRGCPMIGACNGFQVLVQVGLLPGPAQGERWPENAPPTQTVALTDNQDARFHDRWVGIRFEPSVCIWTKGLAEGPDPEVNRLINQLPVAHGEGRLVTAAASILPTLERAGQIAARYTDNYNGSEGAIAGICDASGRIFGLMPHPERYLDWTRHPFWTRLDPKLRTGATPGLQMFQNAVEASTVAAA
jgi:phosphoribosylformylglycinamidine synthase subunit PurQ / glutaminase